MGEEAAGMPRARPQAARKVAPALVSFDLRMFLFGDMSALPMNPALFLECTNQLVIFRVMSNPIPDNVIAIENADGAVVDSNSCRIDWPRGVNGFEVQTWVAGIFDE